MVRADNERFTISQQDQRVEGVTQLRRAFGHGIEYGLNVGWRRSNRAQDRAGCGLLLERLGQLTVAGLDFLVELPELLGCLVDILSQHSEFVPIDHGHLSGKFAGGDLAQMCLDFLDWIDQRPGDDVSEAKRQQDAAEGERNDDQTERSRMPPRFVSIAATMSASAMLTNWFVRRSSRSARRHDRVS